MPYFAGLLGMYCLNGQSPLNSTRLSSTVTFGPGLYIIGRRSTHLFHTSRIAANLSFARYHQTWWPLKFSWRSPKTWLLESEWHKPAMGLIVGAVKPSENDKTNIGLNVCQIQIRPLISKNLSLLDIWHFKNNFLNFLCKNSSKVDLMSSAWERAYLVIPGVICSAVFELFVEMMSSELFHF